MKFCHILMMLCIAATVHPDCLADKFAPVSADNPWPDDYSEVASMENRDRWGTYNVHDPAVTRVGDTYYMYSTDAIYFARPKGPVDTAAMRRRQRPRPMGNVQMRRSKDLVNWEFIGWALPEIPKEAVEWVRSFNPGMRGAASNVWAPYMVQAPDGTFRLYFCVSAFGKKTSYIGLATAQSPEGPWEHKGCVVKTSPQSPMNAIDPTIITGHDGRQWMHYGSYFGGIYCVELDPATGFTMSEGDLGHLTARRANYRRANLEGPEIIYSPEHDMYYLFGSYDPLMTTYSVRVARSKNPEGPFVDFFGKIMSDTTDNYPVLTAPYRFGSHPGWVGNAHCGVFADTQGRFFMAHQGRYAPQPGMMDLHVRQIFFTKDGWPVVSPERYAPVEPRRFRTDDLAGTWELIRITEPDALPESQTVPEFTGKKALPDGGWNLSAVHVFNEQGTIDGDYASVWALNENEQLLNLTLDGENIKNLIIFAGHDWELGLDTVLFTGLDSNGRSVWGKRIL